MAPVQEKPRIPRHRPPRVDLRHVIDMTLVDAEPGSAVTATTSEEENEVAHGVAMEDNSQRQVFPEDVLHALATLETFRHLAAAGIDDELGLEAGTIRHLARLDATSVQALANSDRDRHQHRPTVGQRVRLDSGVASDVEVNLDGKVPPRATFETDETMFDIKIEPLADFIESLTDPDHLERIKEILDKASTPFDYYRIDERVNEFYQADLPADAATSWLARNHGHRSRLPNVPIIRELRIDITTLHPSAIYRLEQFRRRQLREKVLPVRLDVFVEEKEPEWIKQRTREKKLARKLEKEKERVRQLLLEEEERQRCAEERERQQVAMVRRHLGISSAKRDRRHSGGSNGSSEMSSVPSNVSSPTPPPTQIFHEVQESVPFPFGTPVQPVNSSNPPDVSVPSSPLQLIGLSEEHPNAQTIEIGTESAKLSETASALNKAKRLPRLKLKFKGLSPGHSSPALPTNGSLVPEEADTRTNRPHGIQEVSADPSNNGLDATGGTPSASRQSDAKAFLSPSGMASNTTPDRPLSTKLTSTTRVPDGGSGIPHAAEEVITHMAILLSEHNTAVSSFQDPAANVDIAVDLAVDNAASSSTVAQFIDEGRLGLTIRPTSNVEDQEDSRSKVAVAAPPLYSAQDEEDEAVVEAMEGLDTVSGSGSSGGFRYNIEAFSSAGSLQKGTAPVLFPELVADAPCGHMTEVHCSNTLPSSEIPSSGQPIPLPETASEHRQHRPKDALGDSGLGEQRSTMDQADLQMPIDDELEPVTYEDTQAGTWKAIYKDFHGNNTGKGKERIVYNKGKERAKDLSLRIRALDSPDSDDHSPWAQSAKVIQVKGITGPTATDTESASVESPDTRSVSPALLPYMAPSPDTQTIEMPTQPNSEPTTLASTAARPSTERRRQNEALYAALAANFLNRCGSTSQAQPDHDNRPGIQAGLASHSLRHSPGSSSRATSDTPSEPYLLQRLAGLTTCDPRDVFGRLETSTATLIGHVKSERDVGPMEGEGEVLQHEVRDGNEDLSSDNEMLITEASVPEPIILSSELKDNTVLDLPQPDRSSHSDAPSSARSDASRPVLIEEEEDPEMKVLGTTWHRQGRASRHKRKTFPDMISIDQLDLSPPKRHRAIGNSRRSSRTSSDHVLHLHCDEDEDDEPIYLSDKNPWTDPTNVEVVIPIRRHPFSPTPAPIPRAGPNLKIRLNLGPYRQ